MQNSKFQFKVKKWGKLLPVWLVIIAGISVFLWRESGSVVALGETGEVLAEVQGPGPVGDSISCVAPEWYCSGTDVLVPPVECDNVQIHQDDSSMTRCRTCASEYLFPRPEGWTCPTRQDEGQKDGSGQTGTARNYYYFDYDGQGQLISVPPYGFGVGGPTVE